MHKNQTIIITGGAGFIGSAFARKASSTSRVIILDSMTYAGDEARLINSDDSVKLIKGDVCDEVQVSSLLDIYQPNAIIHFAAESHVDRSIDGPQVFLKTNVEGTMTLLRCATAYWQNLTPQAKASFRFLHVSTDEVYGSLGFNDDPFTEDSPYQPNSPYAASKAASDHFVRAWHKTFKLPTLITHCSNNYGPWQFPEKLIPLMISKCLKEEPLPVYGDGSNIRDWVHVDDHISAIDLVLSKAEPGSVWSIGGEAEVSNLEMVKQICDILDKRHPRSSGESYRNLISFVQDRPGHDVRYAIDITKLKTSLGWSPSVNFKDGLEQTITWYLQAQEWIESISQKSAYHQSRLGIKGAKQNKEGT